MTPEIAKRILRHAGDYLYAEYGIKYYHQDIVPFYGSAAKCLFESLKIINECIKIV